MFAGTGASGLPRGSRSGSPGVHLNGSTPVQFESSYSAASLTANPVRTFDEASTSGTAITIVPFSSCSVGGRDVVPASFQHIFDEVAHRRQFCVVAFDDFGFAHHDDGAIVHGMPGGRRRKNNAVEDRHVDREGRAARQRFHQAARSRPVEIKFVADANVVRGHDDGNAVGNERDRADESLIENRVDQFTVLRAAVGFARDARAFCVLEIGRRRWLVIFHDESLARPQQPSQAPK